jgi:hypothetical protein|tara:strand:- start:341 stop:538 length:198 start_codon:yes stop_codon:yes gene_type:complete
MLFHENPYDLETVQESIKIATKQNKELIYMDRLIAALRVDPKVDLTSLNYCILTKLQLLNLEAAQ